MSAFVNTTNRSAPGTRVYCNDCSLFGSIQSVRCLGLDYAPIVLTDAGTRRMFCGTGLKLYCNHLPLFLTTLDELGRSDLEKQTFIANWFANVDRETQRAPLYEGLVAAREAGSTETIAAYVDQVSADIA